MDTFETIVSKRDVRHYTGEAMSDPALSRILQAGRMAGSAKNSEVNRLIVIRDQAVQDAVALAGDFSSWIGSADVIVGFAAPTEQLRLFDVGRQAQNMMLAAHAEGIASCPVTMHNPDEARAAVALPSDWSLPMIITLGVPDQERPASHLKRQRVNLDELVHYDQWS